MLDTVVGIPEDFLGEDQVNTVDKDPHHDGAYIPVRGGGEMNHDG